jgi:hypothetical protein
VTKPCRNVHIPLATFISNQSFRVQVAMIRTQFNLDRAQFELLVGNSASSEFVMCFKDRWEAWVVVPWRSGKRWPAIPMRIQRWRICSSCRRRSPRSPCGSRRRTIGGGGSWWKRRTMCRRIGNRRRWEDYSIWLRSRGSRSTCGCLRTMRREGGPYRWFHEELWRRRGEFAGRLQDEGDSQCECSTEVDQCDLIPLDSFSCWIPICLFRLNFGNGFGSNLFRSTIIWRCRIEISLLCLRRVVY